MSHSFSSLILLCSCETMISNLMTLRYTPGPFRSRMPSVRRSHYVPSSYLSFECQPNYWLIIACHALCTVQYMVCVRIIIYCSYRWKFFVSPQSTTKLMKISTPRKLPTYGIMPCTKYYYTLFLSTKGSSTKYYTANLGLRSLETILMLLQYYQISTRSSPNPFALPDVDTWLWVCVIYYFRPVPLRYGLLH